MGALCVITSVVLAILRLCGVVEIGWLLIASPAIAGLTIEFVLNLMAQD